jgi:hypothetical protein
MKIFKTLPRVETAVDPTLVGCAGRGNSAASPGAARNNRATGAR